MLKFTVPGKPRPQERPYVMGYKTFDRSASKKAKKVIAEYARAALAEHGYGTLGPNCASRLSVRVRFFGARRNSDLDNLYKLCLDSMQGVLYANDSQIDHVECWRHPAEKGRERTEIEVMELS